MQFRPALPTLLLFALLAGCGHKGPVRPLKQPVPAAPQALEVQQKGTRFLVAWNRPAVNQDGSALTNLQGFHVYRMQYDPAEDCPECRDTSALLLDVDLEYLRDVRRSGERFFVWDDELTPGFGYQYSVVPYNRKGRNGEPARLRLPFLIPPATPARPLAENHDQMVRLRWEPVTEPRAGVELLGYNLYRRESDEPFPFPPVNREILTDPAFEDYGVENGHSYLYAVRSVIRIQGKTVESQLSEAAGAEPQPGL